MTYILALAVATGLACGVWGWISSGFALGLIGFAGFAGCTTYFAYHEAQGLNKISRIIVPNMTGVIYASLAIKLIELSGGSLLVNVLATGFISFLMVYQAKLGETFAYMPGAFMACFTTFATGGSIWTFPSILLGYLVGMGCDYGGRWLNTKKE